MRELCDRPLFVPCLIAFFSSCFEALLQSRRYAASKGDNSKVRQMLRQGFAVDSSDYDGRTALMLASAKGHAEVLNSLLAAGCDPQVSPTARSPFDT